jgi:hypothetical protein
MKIIAIASFASLVFLIAGCGGAAQVSGGMYRLPSCASVQCDRIARTVCHGDYILLNKEFAKEKGELISCMDQ